MFKNNMTPENFIAFLLVQSTISSYLTLNGYIRRVFGNDIFINLFICCITSNNLSKFTEVLVSKLVPFTTALLKLILLNNRTEFLKSIIAANILCILPKDEYDEIFSIIQSSKNKEELTSLLFRIVNDKDLLFIVENPLYMDPLFEPFPIAVI